MLTPRAVSHPVLNKAFRRANKRLSIFDPISIETALLNPSMNDTFKADLDINITERRTGHGVPMSPYEVYLNGVELTSDRCDNKGHGVEHLSLPTHKNEIDTYHGRRRFIAASDHHTILWDNFNDNELDKKTWSVFLGASPFEGYSKVTEEDGHVEFFCSNTYYLAGIATREPIDFTNSVTKVKLYTKRHGVCGVSIIPSSEPFRMASRNKGYDVVIWEKGDDKFTVYSGENIVLRKDNLRNNPDTIEITIKDNIIRVQEEGVEVYSEEYKPASKLCNLYLWGQSWYFLSHGSSWADDFLFVGD